MSVHPDWVVPDWAAPRSVRAFVTTRAGGVSDGDYASMNLGVSSGDDPQRVAANRARVRAALPGDPRFLRQVHGIEVADLDTAGPDTLTADAATTGTPGRVALVLTADCMPLFFCDNRGTRVAVAHAGWRGMAAGVIESTLAAMAVAPEEVHAWMGPAIGPDAFEVGAEVRAAFMTADPAAANAFVPPGKPGKYLADLYALARQRLERAGVRHVSGGGFCTYHEPERFFSYRRAAKSGRMGAFIWME